MGPGRSGPGPAILRCGFPGGHEGPRHQHHPPLGRIAGAKRPALRRSQCRSPAPVPGSRSAARSAASVAVPPSRWAALAVPPSRWAALSPEVGPFRRRHGTTHVLDRVAVTVLAGVAEAALAALPVAAQLDAVGGTLVTEAAAAAESAVPTEEVAAQLCPGGATATAIHRPRRRPGIARAAPGGRTARGPVALSARGRAGAGAGAGALFSRNKTHRCGSVGSGRVMWRGRYLERQSTCLQLARYAKSSPKEECALHRGCTTKFPSHRQTD